MSINRDLIIDVEDPQKGGLVRSALSTLNANLSPVVRGDGENIRIFPVRATGSPSSPWKSEDWDSHGIIAAVGNPGALPTGGTFTLSYGGDTTTALPLDSTPAVVEAALDLLAAVIAAGGVSVSGVAGEFYQVTFDTFGARTAITGDGANFDPFGSVIVDDLVIGNGFTYSVQGVRPSAQSLSAAVTFAPVAALAEDVDVIAAGSGSTHAIQRFGFSRPAIGGTFTISFDSITSPSLSWNATAAEVQAAFDDATYLVVGEDGGSWTIEKLSNALVAAGTMNVTGLDALAGWEGYIVHATRQMYLEMVTASGAEIQRTFEIEITPPAGLPFTVYQGDITVKKQVIESGILTALLGPDADTLFSERGALRRDDITLLTGGSSVALDNIATIGLPDGYAVDIASLGDPLIDPMNYNKWTRFTLTTEIAAQEIAPAVIVADDDPDRVWRMTLSSFNGLRVSQDIRYLVDPGLLVSTTLYIFAAFTEYTMVGNITLGKPTFVGSAVHGGMTWRVKLIQDGTGSRTLAFASGIQFSGGTPVLSTAAGAIDTLTMTTFDGGTTWQARLDKAFA